MQTTLSTPFEKQFDHSHALFEAALETFISDGYEQASLNAILEDAEMSKGQFYYHFENKEGLYLALIGVLIERKRAFLAEVMSPEDFEGDIFTILNAQIRHSMAFARQHPQINRFAESFVKEQGSPIYKGALATYNFDENEGINALIEAAYQGGEFREDLPLAFIRKMVTHLFTHFAELLDLYSVKAVEHNLHYLIEFMRSGLARQPRAELSAQPGASHDDQI
jgi:TetR/AcrR family transcriptional regulator